LLSFSTTISQTKSILSLTELMRLDIVSYRHLHLNTNQLTQDPYAKSKNAQK